MTYELGGYGFVSGEDAIPGTNTCDYNRLIAKVVFFDATSGGNEISSNEIVIGDWRTPYDQWIPFTVSTIAPAGAQRVETLFLFLQPACDTGAVYVDDAPSDRGQARVDSDDADHGTSALHGYSSVSSGRSALW